MNPTGARSIRDRSERPRIADLAVAVLLVSSVVGATSELVAEEDCALETGFGMDHPVGAVYAFALYNDGKGEALYAGGGFMETLQVPVGFIACWNGKIWQALEGPAGIGTNGPVLALAVFKNGNGEMLYAGGGFTNAGGVEAPYIARWDGSVWSALPGDGGTNKSVKALLVHDDGSGPALFAGVDFTVAGGIAVNHVSRWDGSFWTQLAGPLGAGTDGDVRAVIEFDDGTGTALYAGGDFISVGGILVNNIASWDGAAWSALSGLGGSGTDGPVVAPAVYDDGTGAALYVGGWSITAGDVPDLWGAWLVTARVYPTLILLETYRSTASKKRRCSHRDARKPFKRWWLYAALAVGFFRPGTPQSGRRAAGGGRQDREAMPPWRGPEANTQRLIA